MARSHVPSRAVKELGPQRLPGAGRRSIAADQHSKIAWLSLHPAAKREIRNCAPRPPHRPPLRRGLRFFVSAPRGDPTGQNHACCETKNLRLRPRSPSPPPPLPLPFFPGAREKCTFSGRRFFVRRWRDSVARADGGPAANKNLRPCRCVAPRGARKSVYGNRATFVKASAEGQEKLLD